MSSELWLVRHGQTEWSRDGRHTGTTDLALTETGETSARALGRLLAEASPGLVLTSPLSRARETARLAGFPEAETDADLVEWDYGDYEGLTTEEIRETVPGWTVWTHPCPGGETEDQLSERIDRVVARVAAADTRALVFAHGHSLRAVAARWLGLPVAQGRMFDLDTATVSILGFYREDPVVVRWNAPSAD